MREAIQNPECDWLYNTRPDNFSKIPGSPIAYWVAEDTHAVFSSSKPLSVYARIGKGLDTGNNNLFLKLWHEVSSASTTWKPCIKGGPFRKWYGNLNYVIDWRDDGKALRDYPKSNLRNADCYFHPGITWTRVSSSATAFRKFGPGFVFESTGPCIFLHVLDADIVLAFLNSAVVSHLLSIIAPTLDFQSGHISVLPVIERLAGLTQCGEVARKCEQLAHADWDSVETSWDFACIPMLAGSNIASSAKESYENSVKACEARIAEMQALETANNSFLIEAYGLQDELSPEVPEDQITLYRPDREEDIKRLISYAIGCMMGRYSLDKPGLIYAHSGNVDFEKIFFTTDDTENTDKNLTGVTSSSSESSVKSVVKFPPDGDGIVPLLETDWGIRDDATHRFEQFINICWPGDSTTDNTDGTDQNANDESFSSSEFSVKSVVKKSPYLEENLRFVADSLGPTKGEHPRDTIRRYLAASGTGGFYKHHLSMYKKRPIYWLFSSGKQRAFQCLVYLHRYHAGTLARMRTEYVIPLQGQIAARIEQLEGDKNKANSTSHRNKLQKEQDKLKKQQAELLTFEEKLKHAADQKITLDLDDGVKTNYAKFGDLLAESKAITGGKGEE